MNRKVRGTGLAALVVLALVAAGCAGGPEVLGESGVLAGTWRGGSAYEPGGNPETDLGVRYLLSLTPLGGGRFGATWEGSYVLPEGYARMTRYSGELAKRADGSYEVLGIAFFNTSAVFPPDTLPQVWAIHGTAELLGDGRLRITYDGFEVHDWKSRPFVDPPLFRPVPTPIVEIYRRVEFGGK